MIQRSATAGRRIYLETFGCQMNVLDSQLVQGQLRALGYRFVDRWQDADVVLYNTCSVRARAEQKVYSRVGRVGRHKRDHPDVAGELGAIDALVAAGRDDLITLIQDVQERYGFLPRNIMAEVASKLGVPLGRLFGIATFYGAFHLKPHGRHVVKVCCGTACHVSGATHITEALAKRLDVEPGETTDDMAFTLERVACVGCCSLAPVVVIGEDTYGRISRQDAVTVVAAIAAAEEGQ